MIIDCHAHTTNSNLRDLHTQTATIADLERLAAEHGIDVIVLMATYFPFKKSGLKNRELLKRITGKPLFRAFISLDAMNKLAEGIQELQEMVDHPQVAGIKLYPGYQDFCLTDEKMAPVYRLAERYNLPVAIHAGALHHCCPEDALGTRKMKCRGACRLDQLGHLAHPKMVGRVAKSFPRVKFIMSHLGNPYLEEAREVMRLCPNVFTDISGQFLSGEEDSDYLMEVASEVRKFLELEKGVERIMFGSDFPIQSHSDSIALVKAVGLTPEDEEKIFSGNARRILRLSVNLGERE